MALGEFVEGVYVTVHEPSDKIQNDWSNVPPALPSLQYTEPIGAIDGFELSETLAVNVTGDPEDNIAGFGVTETVEASIVPAGRLVIPLVVRLETPELA